MSPPNPVDAFQKTGVCAKCRRNGMKVKWLNLPPGYYCEYCIAIVEGNKPKVITCAVCKKVIKAIYNNTVDGPVCHTCYDEEGYCHICKTQNDVLYKQKHGPKFICKDCQSTENEEDDDTAPKFDIEKVPHKASHLSMRIERDKWNRLHNIDTGTVEVYKSIPQLQRCGWFVKEIIEFTPISRELTEKNRKLRYTLVYCGKKKCKRFPDVGWPLDMPMCDDNLCFGYVVGT